MSVNIGQFKSPQEQKRIPCDASLSDSSSVSRCVSADDLKILCQFCPGAGVDFSPFEKTLEWLAPAFCLLVDGVGRS